MNIRNTFSWKIFFHIAIDIATVLLLLLLYLGFFILFNSIVGVIDLPESVYDLSESQIEELSDQMRAYYFGFLLLLLVFTFIFIAVYLMTRGLVWGSLAKKHSMKHMITIVPKGLLWFIGCSIPGALIILSFQPLLKIPALLAYSALFSYVTTIIYLNFSHTGKVQIWLSAKEAMTRHRLALAYLVIFAILFGLYELLNMISFGPISIVIILLMLIILSWSRFLLGEIKRG